MSNFGAHEPGGAELAALTPGQADSAVTRRINRYTHTFYNGGITLPVVQPFETIQLTIINRGAGLIRLYPPEGGSIEGNAAVGISPGDSQTCFAFGSAPKSWYTNQPSRLVLV